MKKSGLIQDKNNLISYFDLIKMIRENKQPNEIKLYICDYSTKYYFSIEDGSYIIKDRKKESQRFSFYLNENLTDVQCFDKMIEIVK